MDHQMLQHRFAALTTAHVADVCIRARVPVRCACALLRAVVPGSRLAGRVCPARHAGSVDAFLEAFDDSVLFLPSPQVDEIFTLADTISDTEQHQAKQIRAGVSLRSQVQFRAYLAKREKTPSLSFREPAHGGRGHRGITSSGRHQSGG